ncbi:unnamed protein product [Gongylonema pulchrum]|uniref:Small vasohibin-binding protein n=2 Tax=Gongylonema pulchrum TaxID=637853 RepID=A0A183EKB9_9BILA|nr:unnamed protein product [Gongylonema pulchrum]
MSNFWSFIDKDGKTWPDMPPTPNSVQQKRREEFIRRSTARQMCIKEASARRRALAAQKRDVAKQLLIGKTQNRDAIKVLARMDREICAFPPQAMKRETVRRVHRTQEFKEKKKQRRDEYDAHVNRLLAYCYSQKLEKYWQRLECLILVLGEFELLLGHLVTFKLLQLCSSDSISTEIQHFRRG